MRLIRTLSILLLLGQAPLFAAEMPAEAPKAGSGQLDEDPDYIVGPGDGIQVSVWGEPALGIAVTVRPDGKISVPQVKDDVRVVGNTPSQIARLIEEKLSETIRKPQVTVIITDAKSEYSKVTVIGQVKMPQTIPYYRGLTVRDVVLKVGGLGDFAKGNSSKIYRKDASGKEQEIPVRLDDLINKGKNKENVAMKPGDVLSVPLSRL